MGSEGYHVFISPSNTEIRPDDFSTFNNKRVGVNKNSIQEQLFKDWAQKHDVHPQIMERTEKTPELLEMLAKGQMDMLVTLDTYGNSADVVPVCKIGQADSFFGISKKRPDIKRELDTAMNRILEENRDYNLQMAEKFNRSSTVNRFLSDDEKDWLADHGPFAWATGTTSFLTATRTTPTASWWVRSLEYLEAGQECREERPAQL